jgi:hypothetical protein
MASPAPASGPAPILGNHNLAMTDLDIFKVTSPPSGYPANIRTFYSPEDYVPQVLQTVVSSASKSIVVAMYGFDDDVLAAMLDTALKTPQSTSRSRWTEARQPEPTRRHCWRSTRTR